MNDFEFPKHIKEVLNALNLTQMALAKEIGLSQGVLSEFASGARFPSKKFLFGISKLGISLDWFLTGNGEMFLSQEGGKDNLPASYSGSEVAIPRKAGTIPLLRQKVSCGRGIDWNNEQNIEEYIDISLLLTRRNSVNLYALTAQGSSMLGAGIQDGDILIFDGKCEQPIKDGTYIFALDGEVYCKRLERDAIAQRLKIFSVRSPDLKEAELIKVLNTESPDFAERFHVFGRVISCTHPTD